MTYSQAITEGPDFYWHKCGDCGAETEGDYGQDAAAAVWNRRVTAASAQAAIDAEKARADRLADIVRLLDECIWFNPDTQNLEVTHDGSVEKARAALQQEG